MSMSFQLIDPPELVEIVSLRIEDCAGHRNYRRFSHFRWRGADFWVLGTMVWRNRLNSGYVKLRLPKGRKIFPAALAVHPEATPFTFSVQRPSDRHCDKVPAFAFEGFSDQLLVNIDFVREEERRWSDLEDQFGRLEPPIGKPPSGTLI